MDKHATIYDIAKRSGVSVATVSRVMRNTGYPVRPQTREKVLEAARALHYTPNAMGKSLKTHTSHDLGVIIPNLTNPSYAMLLVGIQREANLKGYNILLCDSQRDAAHEARNVQILMEKRVAGILLTSIAPDLDMVNKAIDAGFPLITMEQELPLPCIHVGYDYEQAGRLMAQHLLDNGHRRIGFIGAPLDRPSRMQILAGFRTALSAAGVTPQDEDILLSEAESEGEELYEIANGMRMATHFLRMDERPTAFVCLNDLTALGVIRCFHANGMSVPQDASVIGFDNIPYATLSLPPLTTIDQHAMKMGEIAARLMIEQIEQPQNYQYAVRLTPELVERESVRGI